MTTLEDYKLADNKYDWDAYYRAQVATGERCYKCQDLILFAKGYSTLCPECKELEYSPEEIQNSTSVRCPKCRYIMNIWENSCDCYELMQDGTHEVNCWECGHEFPVTTYISYSFSSPALETATEEEDDENADS